MSLFKRKEIVFPTEIKIADMEYKIEVIISKKKNSSVRIKDNTLVFRLSSYLSNNKKEEHFKHLLLKISKKIEISPVKKSITFYDIMNNKEFTFSNERYYIEYTKNRGVKLKENTFYVNPTSKLEVIEKKFVKILIERYYERTKNYLYTLNSQTYNYPIKDFQLKLVSSKWGHCSSDNVILLNLKLLNTDIEVFNYVIFHEIAHIKVKNHSERFWREVSRFCPNYKSLRKKLKENSPDLFVE